MARKPLPYAALLPCLLFNAAVHAGLERWTQVGPAGGEIEALAVNAFTPQVVYAAARSGIFRSDNFGSSWRLLPLDSSDAGFNTLAIQPQDAETLFVGTTTGKVVMTTDGGSSWHDRSPEQNLGWIWSIAVVPSQPLRLYIGTDAGVLVSDDAGLSWRQAGQGLPPAQRVLQVLVHPDDSNLLYARIYPGRLFRSTDGGANWQARDQGLPAALEALALDPTTPAVLYVADQTARIWKTTDGGATWSVPHGGILPFYATLLAVSPAQPQRIFAASLFQKRLLRSLDGGVTWAHLDPGLNVQVHALAPGPLNPQVVYLGSRGSGVLRSLNSGRTWTKLGPAAAGIASLTPDPSSPSHLYATGAGAPFSIASSGMIETQEGGRNWDPVAPANGLELFPYSPIVVSPAVHNTLYAGIFEGLAKSTDGGRTWTVLRRPCRAPIAIHSSPTLPDLLYINSINITPICHAPPDEVVCFSEVSRDGGQTRECVDYFVVALHPTRPETFYALQGGFVRRTRDGGRTWADANPGPTQAFVIDPTHTDRLYATTQGKLWRSDDEGESWTLVNDAHAGAQNFLLELKIDPTAPNKLYAVLNREQVLASEDGGATFTPLSTGLPAGARVSTLVLDPKFPNILYAGTENLGIFRYTRAAPRGCGDGSELCLNGGRFSVRAFWRDFQGHTGTGKIRSLTGDTGLFWFFQPSNLELAVKVLNGSGVNGHFWVFYGALSTVEYRLEVVDTVSGEVSVYFNPRRNLASRADTSAFESVASAASANAPTAVPQGSPPAAAAAGTCTPGPTVLCLRSGRFKVQVTQGLIPAQSREITGDTGAFWFFDQENIELFLKVLDGRPVNGRFWVFFGSLSNVDYTVAVTDMETGQRRTYTNPQGTFGSVADTGAF